MKKNILLLFLAFMTLGVYAQEAAETVQPEEPKPLFKYPQAPDTITSFQDRANYVIARFWNEFDVSKQVKDGVAFEKAFSDYVEFFPHAHKNIVINSIRNLMNKAQSNKTNFLLIGMLAEKYLYSPRAVFASDEAYLPFAEAVVKNKSMKKEVREYYCKQIERINQNVLGAACPDIQVTDTDGNKSHLSELLSDKMTLLFFNDGECSNCALDRIKLSTSVHLNKLISEGNLKIICIAPKKYSDDWAADAKTWADNWTVVASDDAYKVFDVRIAPAIFIINDQKKIADKNVPVSVLTR